MKEFVNQVEEINDLFGKPLILYKKREGIIGNREDSIDISRNTVENSPSSSPIVELCYRTESPGEVLSIYSALLYKINSNNRRYPDDLVVSGDVGERSLDDFKKLLKGDTQRPFMFTNCFGATSKKRTFGDVVKLEEGSSFGDFRRALYGSPHSM